MQWHISDYINPVTVQRYQTLVTSILPKAKVSNDISLSGSHLLFFHPVTAALSEDGYYSYQTPGAILKREVPFRRRMWVQGSIEFKKSLTDGWYNCQEELKFIKELNKDHFVGLKRTIRDEKGYLYVKELRTLIYTNQKVSDKVITKSEDYSTREIINLEDIDVMVYSSISSNPHRIHWDSDYSRNVEGYRDVIVQGPFLVQLVINYFEQCFGRQVSSIKYKNTSHVYAGTDLEICHNGLGKDGQISIILRDPKDSHKVYFECKIASCIHIE